MTDDNTAAFLSVGVQLLPVFWLVLAVETTWLRAKVRQAKTNRQQTVVAVILAGSFPIGAAAECLALFVLIIGPPQFVETFVASYLYLALAYSIIASAIAMYRAIVTAEEEAPPPSTT